MLDPEIGEVSSVPGGVKSAHYIGMTATSLHNRHKTHREDHESGKQSNVMVKHDIDSHEGIAQKYTAKLVQTERSLLHLALREAILIDGQTYGTSINDRHERGKGTGVIRINLEKAGAS